MSRVDAVLARRPALDGVTDRVEKILLAIKTAKSAYEIERNRDDLRVRLTQIEDASSEKSDWCPVCKQGWSCSKREQEYRVKFNECQRERDELKIECNHHAGAHSITLSREYDLRETLKKINVTTHSHVDGRDLLAELHPRNTIDIKVRKDAKDHWCEGDWLSNLYEAMKLARDVLKTTNTSAENYNKCPERKKSNSTQSKKKS